jgi:hypothetical protein
MTKPNDGKFENNTQALDDNRNGHFIRSFLDVKRVSVALTLSLTIYLSVREQFLYALCAAALTVCAATSDRLKRLSIGLRGFTSEWHGPRTP